MSRDNHNYDQILASLNLSTLSERRRIADLCFLFKIVNGGIKCPSLLRDISLYAPSRTLRGRASFYCSNTKSKFGARDPVNRIVSVANLYSDHIDFFGGSIQIFKNNLRKIVIN